MTKKMLIDATHGEETRVAVVDGHRLVDYDYESKVRKQLKGSIFLAKVTRVEPSLQAAFVNFGGNRHGFLPFSEIHPDYFRIPIADREALLAAQADALKALEEEEDAAEAAAQESGAAPEHESEEGETPDHEDDHEDDHVEEIGGEDVVAPLDEDESHDVAPAVVAEPSHEAEDLYAADNDVPPAAEQEFNAEEGSDADEGEESGDAAAASEGENAPDNGPHEESQEGGERRPHGDHDHGGRGGRGRGRGGRGRGRHGGGHGGGRGGRHGGGRDRASFNSRRVEMVGGDGMDGDHPIRPTAGRNYKIQEVVKRGQIMLIQVSKEERGNKGAAVSTYLSLPGRYCVLMPNSTRAGGVSRKIANYEERSRMREILAELQVPEGMSVIMRTAGMSRTKTEIKRDLDYLMKLWDSIRELTLASTAPAVIHEEGNLIRRSIRDIYGRDVDEIIVQGEAGFELARDFMKMMIPSHVKRVQHYPDGEAPLFTRFGVENQISSMSEATVQLKSGGYLVINPTEALVSVDVNSGRATKERHIEETALKTNIEAADEVARQLRLRDLGGLVVVDFIDMEDRRNNRKVEERLKQALSSDRARIQIGRISSFGLLELSRQRLNPSLTEAQFEKCAHCAGSGVVRTTDSAAVIALRSLEDEGAKGRAQEIKLKVSNDVALYLLNNKRRMLGDIENRYGLTVQVQVETAELPPSGFLIEVARAGGNGPKPLREIAFANYGPEDDVADSDAEEGESEESETKHEPRNGDENGEGGDRPRRRRRGRRGGRRHNGERQPSEGGGPDSQDGQPAPQHEENQAFESNLENEDGDNFGNRDSNEPDDMNGNSERHHGRSHSEGGGQGTGDRPRRRRGGRNRSRGGQGGGGQGPRQGGGGRGRQGGQSDRGGLPPGEFGTAPGTIDYSGLPADLDEGDDAPVAAPVRKPREPARESSRESSRETPSAREPQADKPSNDTTPPPPRDYERVNEPPSEKKRGWWRRSE